MDILSNNIDCSKQGYPHTLDTYGMVAGVVQASVSTGWATCYHFLSCTCGHYGLWLPPADSSGVSLSAEICIFTPHVSFLQSFRESQPLPRGW